MSHTPAWITALNDYVRDRPVEINAEFTGRNRESRRDRHMVIGGERGRRVPLGVIGKTGFSPPQGRRAFPGRPHPLAMSMVIADAAIVDDKPT